MYKNPDCTENAEKKRAPRTEAPRPTPFYPSVSAPSPSDSRCSLSFRAESETAAAAPAGRGSVGGREAQ